MPKKIKPEDYYEEDIEDEEEEADEDEEGAEEEQEQQPRQPARVRTRGRPPKMPQPKVQSRPQEVKRRFEAFHQQELIGVRDVESGEILAQGFTDLGSAMVGAEELERLERIETAIGVIQG